MVENCCVCHIQFQAYAGLLSFLCVYIIGMHIYAHHDAQNSCFLGGHVSCVALDIYRRGCRSNGSVAAEVYSRDWKSASRNCFQHYVFLARLII